MLVRPECTQEWTIRAGETADGDVKIIREANGNTLSEVDTVTVIKDLKVKGSSLVVKVGTKVKNIHLVDGEHDIDCNIKGTGAMGLKSEFVKKSWGPEFCLLHSPNIGAFGSLVCSVIHACCSLCPRRRSPCKFLRPRRSGTTIQA